MTTAAPQSGCFSGTRNTLRLCTQTAPFNNPSPGGMAEVRRDKAILLIVYFSILLDNLLLTVVVPIVPDYLVSVESPKENEPQWILVKNRSTLFVEEQLKEENGKVGILLSSKAVVQIVFNPIVGCLASSFGYTLPLFFGTINLLASSLLYALGESYIILFLARSLQGLSSACIGVSGMCLVADNYTDEGQRSKVMGIVLGAVALGVLLGYPYGGFSYDFLGKMAPFLGIAFLAILDITFQLAFLNMKPPNNEESSRIERKSEWKRLLSDKLVMLTAGAIWLSSSAMAILEPCLPLWLMSKLHPEKWELGTVFIPDSIGYLIGTNCFGEIAYKFGRWRVAILSLILVAVSACVLPSASTMKQLVLPHMGLGLGIGVADSALVPLLATLVDKNHRADYATVYAIQQTSVSLAYALGPMFGGELVRVMGFPWLMRLIGIINLLYAPLLVFLSSPKPEESHVVQGNQTVSYRSTENIKNYSRFVDSDDSD